MKKGLDGCRIEGASDNMRCQLARLRRVEWSQLDLLEAAFPSERL